MGRGTAEAVPVAFPFKAREGGASGRQFSLKKLLVEEPAFRPAFRANQEWALAPVP